MSHVTAQSVQDRLSVTIYSDYEPARVHVKQGDTEYSFLAGDVLLKLIQEAIDTHFVVQVGMEKLVKSLKKAKKKRERIQRLADILAIDEEQDAS